MLIVARIAFGLFFLGSAVLKIYAASYEMDMMRAAGFANPLALYVTAAVAQAIAGLALLSGRMVVWACLGLIAYVAVVNYFLHAFWLLEGEAASIQFQLFTKNLGIMAGLLAIAGASGLNKNTADDTTVRFETKD